MHGRAVAGQCSTGGCIPGKRLLPVGMHMQMPLAPFDDLLADDPACQRSACCQTRSSGCWPPTRAAQPQTARILCPLVVWCAGCCSHGLRGALNTLQGAYPGCSPSRTAPACRRAMPMFNRCRTQRPAATIMRRVLACMKLSGHSSDQASSPATAADATRTAQDFPYMQRAQLPCRVTVILQKAESCNPPRTGHQDPRCRTQSQRLQPILLLACRVRRLSPGGALVDGVI